MTALTPAISATLRRSPNPRRIFVLGATGTIGRATVRALVRRGHDVVCFIRPRGAGDDALVGDRALGGSGALVGSGALAGSGAHTGNGGLAQDRELLGGVLAQDRALAADAGARPPAGVETRVGDVQDPASLAHAGFRGERFDALVSCMASRTGAPQDAWAVDYRAHVTALEAARSAGVSQVVLLSAICVQKPVLAFQHAKLAFEQVLTGSGVAYSIVRPTAFFKSLSGQIDRVRRGKPFLVFGDGTLTACKPISDGDLADYLADCLDDQSRRNRVLPIGGPGDAITPRQQGEHLFALLGRPPRFRHVPVALLDAIIRVLGTLGHAAPAIAAKAELARIGRYYATESMLVLNPDTGRYDAAATPSTGTETLFDFYARVVNGAAAPERGDHAVF